MPAEIVLDELQGYSEPVELDREVAAALRDTGLVSVVPAQGGGWSLLPVGRVGAVQIDDLLVRVKPKEKVGLSRLLFLLGYAADPGFRPDNVIGAEDEDLFAALAESLARHAERALERGPLNGYVSVEEALRTVKGRIRVGDQMSRRPGLLLPLEVSYDDHTSDVVENQILRAAIRTMMRVPRLPEALVGRLAHVESRLEGVSALNQGAVLPAWTESRTNSHYVPALRLSEIILRSLSAESGVGHRMVASFVVNMATVFEDFVATALKEALDAYPGLTEWQYEAYLDKAEPGFRTNERVQMFVDVVHFVSGRPYMIFDAKYKAASANGAYPNADQYQMLAYCTALGVSRAWLVYAGRGETRFRRIRNTGVSVVEFPLDLSRDPESLLERVKELAQRSYTTAFPSSLPGANR
ncbi:restriction endonuclease [Arthrobacter sp. efr-133-TYG-104]|uniref:McrC family protein n=1 Tax=Arthrobacter sp. efr-133-TYG-104 TaxID=3040324 RepID=UPI00254FC972|nr:restriction endonuclease [Arthrobacter sp. efr-133-TYG-104]